MSKLSEMEHIFICLTVAPKCLLREKLRFFFRPLFWLAAKTTTTDIDITLHNECARNSFQIPNVKDEIKNHPTDGIELRKKLCNQC